MCPNNDPICQSHSAFFFLWSTTEQRGSLYLSMLCHACLSAVVWPYLFSLCLQRLQVIGNVLQFFLQLSTFTYSIIVREK